MRWIENNGGFYLYYGDTLVGHTSEVLEGDEPQGWVTTFHPTDGGIFCLDRMPTREQAQQVVQEAYQRGLTWESWTNHPELGDSICAAALGISGKKAKRIT